MTAQLINAVKRHVSSQIDRIAQPRWGLVTSVDPSRPAVKVTLQPEGVLTGWLPITQMGASGGWGAYMVPMPGMMAFCVPDNGIAGHWVVVGFSHSDASVPAKAANTAGLAGVPSAGAVGGVGGELLMVHQSGSVIRMCADGSIYMRAPNLNIDGSVKINGNLLVEENIVAVLDISDQNGAHQTMAALRTAYNEHRHTQPNDGHGDAEQPTDLTDHPVT